MKVKLSSIWRVTLALVLVLGISLVAAVPSLAIGANPTAPTLGEAGRYVILASQTITTTGATAISGGDIGILDEAHSYFLTGGFTPGVLMGDFTQLTGGTSQAWDDAVPAPFPRPLHYSTPVIGAGWTGTNKQALIDQSRTDLGIAYTFLAADPNPTAATTVWTEATHELGGVTLTRGVYKTAFNVGISTPLQLDAQGDPNSVWIFTIDGNLTTGATGNISFVGGIGSANNVYWRVAGTTTIAAGTTFYGNVLDNVTIAVNAGATITGRLFSKTAAVTLIADTVTMPALLPVTYTVTFDLGSHGTLGSGTLVQTVNSGAGATAPVVTANAGWNFTGWDVAFNNITSNLTVTAQYSQITYTLTYTAGANGSISGASPQTVNSGASGTAVTAVAANGYHFVNWSDASTANPRTDTNVTANITVTASFAINTYTVTFNANGGNGVTPTSESATFGQLVTAPSVMPTRTGYALSGWNTAANGTGTAWTFASTTMTAGDMTLYAQWNVAPTVISTVPANAAIGVAINSAMTATFSTAMNSSTILASGTFTLKQGSTPIGGTVSYAGVTATFQPTVSLAYGTTYTATISTAAQDTAGTNLAAPYSWSFTTRGPVSVGGNAYPINTAYILIPALILALIALFAGRAFVLRRRTGR
jgi:uncharacterized repeat protein (TIGR02543 family)